MAYTQAQLDLIRQTSPSLYQSLMASGAGILATPTQTSPLTGGNTGTTTPSPVTGGTTTTPTGTTTGGLTDTVTGGIPTGTTTTPPTGTTTGTTTGTGTTGGLPTDTLLGGSMADTLTGGTGTDLTGTNTGTLPNNLLESSILPVIGQFTDIGRVGTGFDWNPFIYNDINDLGKNVDYGDYLSSFAPYNATIERPQPASLTMGTNSTANQFMSGQPQPTSFNKYVPFTYSDTNTQSAVDQLDALLNKAMYTTIQNSIVFGQPITPTKILNKGKLDPNVKGLLKEVDIGRTGVSLLDAANDTVRTKLLNDVSAKTGIPADQLEKLYNDYHYANKVFFEPGGTNWGDLMASPASEDVRTGIKSWSKLGPELDKANDLLSRETVAVKFTDQNFGVSADSPVKEIKDKDGNTFFAAYDKATGTQFIARDRASADQIASGQSGLTYDAETGKFYDNKDVGEYLDATYYALNKPMEGRKVRRPEQNFTAINKMMSIDDFLPPGVTIRSATPEQIAQAQTALQGQIELMGNFVSPTSLVSDVGKTYETNKFGITADQDPVKKGKSFLFVNDVTGQLTSVKDRNIATWAADDVANDTPFEYNGKIYYIDKDDGSIKSTKNRFIAEGESSTPGYLQARTWQQFLPPGVTEAKATPEQILQAKTAFTNQQESLSPLLGKGSVYNLFDSNKLDIPKNFVYDPSRLTREFNTLVNMGINPTAIDEKRLSPENVYRESLRYEAPDNGMLGSFVGSFILPALSIINPALAPYLQYAAGAYQLSQGNIMGALGSFAGASNVMKDLFGGSSILGSMKDSLSGALQSGFGMSADAATKAVNAGVWAGGSAVMAALNDQNVLEAMAMGAGEQYLRDTINSNLASSIKNEGVRNFITNRLTSSVMNAFQGGNVDFEKLFATAFGTGMLKDMNDKVKSGLKP